MSRTPTELTRKVLAGINYSGIDRLYQQLGSELGMILTFHHVRNDPVPKFAPNAHLSITPEFLDTVIRLLKKRHFDIVSIDEARRRILNPMSDRRFAVLTFDDGYKNTLTHAVPVLREHDVPYIVYLAPGLMEGTADLWWEGVELLVRQQERIVTTTEKGPIEIDCSSNAAKHRAYKILHDMLAFDVDEMNQRQRIRELCWLYKVDIDAHREAMMMDWKQVHEIATDPLCTIGAHSINHHALARLTLTQARSEMVESTSILEAELGQRPKHFAYPYGYQQAAAKREFDLAKRVKFATAVTTRPGMIFPSHAEHLTALPRVSVNGLFQRMRYLAPLTSGLPTRLGGRFRKLDVA